MNNAAPLIYQKISSVMNEVGAIGKNHKNPQQGYFFRGIDDLYAALQPALIAHQVFYVPNVIKIEREERQNRSGGALIYTNLQVEYTFYAADGSSVKAVVAGEAMDSGDKSTNKAMSAALKYALLQIFCVPTETSEDAGNFTHDLAPSKQPAADKKTAPQRPANSNSVGKPEPPNSNISPFPTKDDLPDKKLSPRDEHIAQIKRLAWKLKLCANLDAWQAFLPALVGATAEAASLEALQKGQLALEKAEGNERLKAWAMEAWKVSSVTQSQALGLMIAFAAAHTEEELLNITGPTPKTRDAKSIKTMLANLESFLAPESEAA